MLTLDDLANHRSEWVDPISTDYRGIELFEIPPNGQGLTALMTLNILRQTDLAQYAHLGPDHVHLLSEAFSLSIAERDRFVSDSAFNDLPIDDLLHRKIGKTTGEITLWRKRIQTRSENLASGSAQPVIPSVHWLSPSNLK